MGTSRPPRPWNTLELTLIGLLLESEVLEIVIVGALRRLLLSQRLQHRVPT